MNMCKNIFLLFLLGITINVYAQSNTLIQPKTYTAYKTIEPINVDGKVNESIWKNVEWSSNFIDIEGVKNPKYQTNIKMIWDENFFYILANIQEPHIWANITEKDAVIFHNNDFEVFIDPENDTHNYYELEINALNTVWDLFITKPYRELNSSAINDWNISGLKSAIGINGTLNNPTDIDKGWIVEIAIPWSAYKTSYYQDVVPRDMFWRINFSRVNWKHTIKDGVYSRKKNDDEKYLKEYNWVWSPQGVVNMHEPEKWGYVLFSSKELGSNSFIIPEDEQIKWEMYNLHRKQNQYFKKNKKWVLNLNELQENDIIIRDEIIKFELETHKTGYNLSVISPFTKKELVLTDDGKMSVN